MRSWCTAAHVLKWPFMPGRRSSSFYHCQASCLPIQSQKSDTHACLSMCNSIHTNQLVAACSGFNSDAPVQPTPAPLHGERPSHPHTRSTPSHISTTARAGRDHCHPPLAKYKPMFTLHTCQDHDRRCSITPAGSPPGHAPTKAQSPTAPSQPQTCRQQYRAPGGQG